MKRIAHWLKPVVWLNIALWLQSCGTTAPITTPAAPIARQSSNTMSEADRQRFQHARLLLDQGQTQKAQAELKALLSANPGIDTLWMNLALASYQEGNYKGAADEARRVLSLDKGAFQAHNVLGLVAIKQGQFSAAKTQFEASLALNPQYANANYNLALLYDVYLQDIPQAISYYRRYLASHEDDQRTADWVVHLQQSISQ